MVTDTCKREATHGNQCPDENRDGFVFSDEFSADWNDLDQTEVQYSLDNGNSSVRRKNFHY